MSFGIKTGRLRVRLYGNISNVKKYRLLVMSTFNHREYLISKFQRLYLLKNLSKIDVLIVKKDR